VEAVTAQEAAVMVASFSLFQLTLLAAVAMTILCHRVRHA
jgi:hypothetical protein